jgi:phosphoglycerate dehydrogenase-like enzyme
MAALPLHPRRVLVAGGDPDALARRLQAARPDLELRAVATTAVTAGDLAWADTYVGFKRPTQPSMGNVRWVHSTGAGTDPWFHPTPLARDVVLTRTSESFGPAIAEWALARALAWRQQLSDLADCQRRHEWAPREVTYVRGSRAVVLGTGDVGTAIGRAFSALGVEVLGVSRSGRGDPAVFATTSTPDGLDALAATADWLVVGAPLTAETRGLVSRDVLLACRGAVLMNAGRGAVVDEAAIPEALDRGALAAAILDVFAVEPLPPESPLWDHPRVMISPHMSGRTTVEGALAGFLECLEAFERGEWPRWVVDRERGY